MPSKRSPRMSKRKMDKHSKKGMVGQNMMGMDRQSMMGMDRQSMMGMDRQSMMGMKKVKSPTKTRKSPTKTRKSPTKTRKSPTKNPRGMTDEQKNKFIKELYIPQYYVKDTDLSYDEISVILDYIDGHFIDRDVKKMVKIFKEWFDDNSLYSTPVKEFYDCLTLGEEGRWPQGWPIPEIKEPGIMYPRGLKRPRGSSSK